VPHRPLLLGHRGTGVSGAVPENTVAAFDLALKNGCDGFEFDVRLTGCGRAVVCHDAKVKGVVVAQAECGQLAHLPVLDEVLQRYANRAFLNIELKVPGIESMIVIALREHGVQSNYVVSSFLPDVLTELRVRSSDIVLGFICDGKKGLSRWRELPVKYVIPQQSLVSRELVREIHGEGRMVFSWTVNDASSMRRLHEWGVDGIISDNTELLVSTFDECKGSRPS
jgi:glycerophosphoryl diester phosphodiesterase